MANRSSSRGPPPHRGALPHHRQDHSQATPKEEEDHRSRSHQIHRTTQAKDRPSRQNPRCAAELKASDSPAGSDHQWCWARQTTMDPLHPLRISQMAGGSEIEGAQQNRSQAVGLVQEQRLPRSPRAQTAWPTHAASSCPAASTSCTPSAASCSGAAASCCASAGCPPPPAGAGSAPAGASPPSAAAADPPAASAPGTAPAGPAGRPRAPPASSAPPQWSAPPPAGGGAPPALPPGRISPAGTPAARPAWCRLARGQCPG
mmetsp:Transcript_13548/g.32777  ORF Transcript_13548/g.32777 Transcript_13548/m.32777 type:complete len:260 (-) Transcript_13548:974-1753(-)